MSKFHELMTEELARARDLHQPFTTLHHAHGVIQEEFEEFWDYIKADDSKRNILRELVSVASACQRAAEDLGLLED